MKMNWRKEKERLRKSRAHAERLRRFMEERAEAAALYDALGSVRAVADALGLPYSTADRRIAMGKWCIKPGILTSNERLNAHFLQVLDDASHRDARTGEIGGHD
jgi:hypothetical protein